MATTKNKNGNTAFTDVANQATEEVKVVMDSMLEATNKIVEESKPYLNAQQKAFKDGFSFWQEYNQAYFNLFTETTRKAVDQSMAFHAELLKLAEANVKNSQEVFASEQSVVLESLQAFQAQSQATSERYLKLFTPATAS